jgi:hypothetical protein
MPSKALTGITAEVMDKGRGAGGIDGQAVFLAGTAVSLALQAFQRPIRPSRWRPLEPRL